MSNLENEESIELPKVKCTRFHVEMVDTNKSDDPKICEEENEKESYYAKSLKYFTREALPRLDNYRNIMSIQAAYRPTLEDLHDPISISKVQNPFIDHSDKSCLNDGYYTIKPSVEFGWVEGVLIPNLLNMCSSVLFLRFIWIITQTGLVESLILISFGGIVSIITALSVCAISTNGFIKEGGTYVMMSRSLGPEFGIPIGIVLLVGNIGLCSMYTLGLIEYVFSITNLCIFDCSVQDIRYISMIMFLCITLVVAVSFLLSRFLFFFMKTRVLFFFFMVVTFFYYMSSFYVGIKDDKMLLFNVSVIEKNLFSKYSGENNIQDNLFFSSFAIFYPAFAEFLAGVNASGYLKDPLKAIPKGTILSIIITVLVYITTAVLISGKTVYPENLVNIINNSSSVSSNCTSYICQQKQNFYFNSGSEKAVIHIVIILATLYCIFINCKTAISSFKILSTDKLYPKLSLLNTRFSENGEVYVLIICVGFLFLLTGKMNVVAPIVSIILLTAYAVVNFSTFHISLIQPIGWRPTFKRYNMWISLFGSIVCLSIMFLISWVTALITVIIVLALYLFVTYQKPDVNWGSSTQARMYNNALLNVYALNSVADHVKNYRPQVLVLSGLPSQRPPLVTFARLITKHLSLMICGHIHTNHISQNELNEYFVKAQNWLKFHRMKTFYTQVSEVTFEEGAKSLMQATGLGKLRPNVVLMGYKNNWISSNKKDLDMYFNTIHQALDSHFAICILRVKTGLDFSELKVDHEQISETVPSIKYEFNAMNQLLCSEENENNPDVSKKLYGNCVNKQKNSDLENSELNDSYEDIATNDIYKYKNGLELSGDMMSRVTQFQGKQKKGTIDVWWLYDDGGLTLLLPYIISTRRSWSSCKLRVFALSGNHDTLEYEQRNMASLLSKFRIDYSDLTIFSGLTKKPQEETIAFYENLIKDFVSKDTISEEKVIILEGDLSTMQDKTNRHLRLRELLLENSQDANLIVMTLPIPRKSVISAALYMSWLEALTQDMPPFLLVRGNQSSVLTFYS